MAKKKNKGGKGKKKAAAKAKAPTRRTCACVASHFAVMDKFPDLRAKMAMNEAHTNVALRRGTSAFRSGITTIPVVVHVIHRTARENISDAQIKSQIKVLNKDFRATNADINKVPAPFKPLVGDAKIEFKLATKDPSGNPTNGIVRKRTAHSSFTFHDEMKSSATGGSNPWNPRRYLNIWVCTLAGSLLGYAYFPGVDESIDGVVILNTAFGTAGTAAAPFNKGRTTTHEIGHYLNLHHIWGSELQGTCIDSDYVDDTPNQYGSNTRTPNFPSISCNNGPNGDMFMNYMDYVDDKAMFMFTQGQVARMQAALTGPRSELGN